jgi:uncharacterized membrane protein YkgB
MNNQSYVKRYPVGRVANLLHQLERGTEVINEWTSRSISRYGLNLSRIGLGVVFFWFGALKLIPGLSPAESLVQSTLFFLDPSWAIPALGLWEMTIGAALLSNRCLRMALTLMLFHLLGTALPLVVVPGTVWNSFPYALTLEGQYIVKNLVLLGSGLVLLGKLSGESPTDSQERKRHSEIEAGEYSHQH